MKITGYALREAIKRHELRRETAAGQFDGSKHAFEDEKKDSLQKVMEAFLTAETAVAKLQTAQMRYNLAVTIDVAGFGSMTLAEAIKVIGGLGRGAKMWKSVAAPKRDRYASEPSRERDPGRIFAKAQISTSDAVKLASEADKRCGALRAAIAVGNAREVDVEGLDGSLFE